MSSSLPCGTSLRLDTSTFGPHPPALHSEAPGLHVTDLFAGTDRVPDALGATIEVVERTQPVAVEELDLKADERAWLQARLEEYRELLDYLHDH